ncbi:unnamed protein product [Arabis nemorensis]|uniref:Uncharacterized protein n=1 Tax=Arabis nemorensis TaxID=586526 RepID=A0A565CCP3_9BRAS|nr:unnamed protein product [Arabis nemorensis]
MDKLMKRPTIDGQTFYVDTLTDLAQEVFYEIHPIDPLERTLVNSVVEEGQFDEVAKGYARMMDASKKVMSLVANVKRL